MKKQDNTGQPTTEPLDVYLWLNLSACCVALVKALIEEGWNPIVKSYGAGVPRAETDGQLYYGLDRIYQGLVAH